MTNLTKIIGGHEVMTDGQTVWVNSGVFGGALARFTRVGIDVHGAEGGCVDCGSGSGKDTGIPTTTLEDWKRFQRGVQAEHNIAIPNVFCPVRLEDAVAKTKTKKKTTGVTKAKVKPLRAIENVDGVFLNVSSVLERIKRRGVPFSLQFDGKQWHAQMSGCAGKPFTGVASAIRSAVLVWNASPRTLPNAESSAATRARLEQVSAVAGELLLELETLQGGEV